MAGYHMQYSTGVMMGWLQIVRLGAEEIPVRDCTSLKYHAVFLSLFRPGLWAFERQLIQDPEVAVWHSMLTTFTKPCSSPPVLGTVCSRPMGHSLLSHLSIGAHISGYQEQSCTSQRAFQKVAKEMLKGEQNIQHSCFFFIRLVEMKHLADPSDVSYRPPSPPSSGR